MNSCTYDKAFRRRPLDAGTHIRIGSRAFINYNLTALDVAAITIGNNVWIGGGAIVLPTTIMLDALIEGLSIHRALALDPMPDAVVRDAVGRIVTSS